MAIVDERELARLRAMTAAEKLKVSHALWQEAWQLKRASLGKQHPEWSDAELDAETRRIVSGGER